jgi:hypothetical protein
MLCWDTYPNCFLNTVAAVVGWYGAVHDEMIKP